MAVSRRRAYTNISDAIADEAVRSLNDHDSIVDTQIANAIDEHLRAIDRLCRFGIDGGFGKKHPVKEY